MIGIDEITIFSACYVIKRLKKVAIKEICHKMNVALDKSESLC